ncbi:MAG: precorrin-8X/cobalt-precorrin-8 methylmutase [Cocleimonas sp.]|jgi:precorrin-8X/cobalt-precorrin-8 methylmutase
MLKYEKNPKIIQKLALEAVTKKVDLTHLSPLEKELALQILIATGDMTIVEDLRISEGAIEKAFEGFEAGFDLLCDTDMVAAGLKQKYLGDEPICLINKANVISQAKSGKRSRSMVAVELWKPYLTDSFVIIGRESTALFRLLELLRECKDNDCIKTPAMIIAMPVGFYGASESKSYLWEHREEIDIPCITILGNRGGTDVATMTMNTLLQMYQARVDDKK